MNECDINTIIAQFMPPLLTRTAKKWCIEASKRIDLILIDHAHCEKKAASFALSLIYRYPEHYQLLRKLSRLAREELRHFEQVITLAKQHQIQYQHLPPANYAHRLHQQIASHEPQRLIDNLLVAALIEARSCERFASLIPYLPEWLANYYQTLLQCEARHYQDYLQLAIHCQTDIDESQIRARLAKLATIEAEIITKDSDQLRFHSGMEPQF